MDWPSWRSLTVEASVTVITPPCILISNRGSFTIEKLFNVAVGGEIDISWLTVEDCPALSAISKTILRVCASAAP